jgi:ribosome-interacting GTPase 1
MGICDKIAEIETEIARTQKNKGEYPVIFSVKSPTQPNIGVKIR